MKSAFDIWIGRPVIMQLDLGDVTLSLRGVLLKDRAERLLMRSEDGPELQIPKAMVLSIEEGRCSSASHTQIAWKALC